MEHFGRNSRQQLAQRSAADAERGQQHKQRRNTGMQSRITNPLHATGSSAPQSLLVQLSRFRPARCWHKTG
jgi:hypothetical protein